jgi:phosphoribosylamine--glycine ligase
MPAFVDDHAVTVVLCSEGYPTAPRTGDLIAGIAEAEALGATVFCAGVAAAPDGAPGRFVTAGGRVLDVTATGATLAEARERAYTAARRISWPGIHYRSDIAGVAATTA